MPVQVQGPDGKTYQFPDGTDKAGAISYFKKKGIGVKAAPEKAPTPPSMSSQILSGAEEVGGRALQTFASPVLHPIDTITGMVKQIGTSAYDPRNPIYQRVEEFVTEPNRAKAYEDVAGDVLGMAAQGAALHELPRFKGAMTKTLESTRAAPRAMVEKATGTSPRATADLVAKTSAGNQAADAFSSVRASIETAREKALKAGNEKYSAINEKLNDIPANEPELQSAVGEAEAKIKGSETKPAILKDIASRLKNGDFVYQGGQKFGPGTALYESVKSSPEGLPGGETKPLSYKDLQGYYSELGTELSKGSLPGDVYTALDTLHEAIGNDMQRIADSQGLGQQLTDARTYWRRMKQTFGKPLNQNDTATSTLRSMAPEMAEQDTIANRVRLMGSFDPEIPKQFEQLNKARESAKGGPTVTPGETKTVGSEDIRKTKTEAVHKTADYIHRRALTLATFVTGYKALSAVGRAAMGDPGALSGLPADIGEGAVVLAGMHGLANFLESPKILKMLTEPTAKDLATIPPELRGDLKPIVEAAKKQGIKVDPKLAALVGVSITPKGPKTKQLEDMREQQSTPQQ